MKKNEKQNKDSKAKNKKDEKINLNNEIIIGLTPKETPKENKKKNKVKKIKNKSKNKSTKKINKKQKRKYSKRLKVLEWTSLFIILIVLIILLLQSSIFNIKEIIVQNNKRISSEEIINLSTLKVDTNMFKYSNKAIRNNLKNNAYVEDVKISRNLKGIVTLVIIERKPTYMLKFGNSYVYINNQGYMLEISEKPLELPTITGYQTSTDYIKEGNRLIVSDLEKLEDIIKIMNSTNGTGLENIITSINIENKNNYILEISSENKIVQFGDATNINIKHLKIQELLEQEKGVPGQIYFQDSERTVFKEDV